MNQQGVFIPRFAYHEGEGIANTFSLQSSMTSREMHCSMWHTYLSIYLSIMAKPSRFAQLQEVRDSNPGPEPCVPWQNMAGMMLFEKGIVQKSRTFKLCVSFCNLPRYV